MWSRNPASEGHMITKGVGRRLFFIINPAARSYTPEAESLLRKKFPDADFTHTACHGDGTRLALLALSQITAPSSVIIPCGGDGTFREVAQAVGEKALLSIGPLGTVNQVGAQLGLRTLGDTAAALENGREIDVYPGLARFDEETEWRMFFIGVSAGPDADAVHLVNPRLKKAAGGVAYAAAFFRRMTEEVSPSIICTVEEDGRTERFAASQAIALANGLYGGKFRFANDFGPSDRRVELALTSGGRLGVTSFFLSSMLPLESGQKNRKITGGSLKMELPGMGSFQIDGDAVRARTARIISPSEPVRIIAPVKAG